MEKVEPIRDREKIKTIKSILKGKGKYRDLLWVTIGLNTALRISDILDLKVKDVRKEDGEYYDHIRLREQKTNKSGKHKINQSIKEALDLFFEHNPSKGPEDYLFTTYAGRLTRQRANAIIHELTDAVGLEGRYGTHTLRKSFGYHALQNGAPVRELQDKFNHNSSSLTLDYCGITQDNVDRVVEELNL